MGRRTLLMIAAVVIAALGATMIFLYVQGIDNRAQAGQEPLKVLVATDQITAGETIESATESGKLDLKAIPKEDVAPGALNSTETLDGQIALGPIFPGDQIVPGKFGQVGTQNSIQIPDKNLAMSVQLDDPARVAGFLNPGSQVAIFATTTNETRLLLPRVSVLGVGQTTVLSTTTTDETGAQTTEQIPKTILTLSTTQAEAEKIIFSFKKYQLSFALLTKDSAVAPSDGANAGNVFKPVATK